MRYFAGVLDIPRKHLDPALWSVNEDEPKLKGNIREDLIYTFVKAVEKEGIKNPLLWISDMVFVGGMATYQYRDISDIDVHVHVDWGGYREENDSNESDDAIRNKLVGVAKKLNDEKLIGTHPVQYYISKPYQREEIADAVYSLIKGEWLKLPDKPTDVPPIETFKKELGEAYERGKEMDGVIGQLRRSFNDYSNARKELESGTDIDPKMLESVIRESEQTMELASRKLVEMYEKLKDDRHKIYDKLHEQGITDNKKRLQPAEVIFKYLEGHQTIDVARDLKKLLDADAANWIQAIPLILEKYWVVNNGQSN